MSSRKVQSSFAQGILKPSNRKRKSCLPGQVGDLVARMPLAEKNPEKLAAFWTQGNDIQWELLHKGGTVRKIPLPTYPFARDRYWVPNQREERGIYQEPTDMAHENAPAVKIAQQEPVREFITQFLARELHLPNVPINPDKNIQDYGVNSIIIMKLARHLEKDFEVKLKAREIMEYATVNSLSDHINQKIRGRDFQNTVTIFTENMSNADHEVIALEQFKNGILALDEIESMIEKGEIACI